MGSTSAYLIQRRMAQVFCESLKGCDVLEVFLEDIAAFLSVPPSLVVKVVNSPKGRRGIELIALQSGYRIRVFYTPGVIMVVVK